MDLRGLLHFFLHLDDQLATWITQYGTATYALLFTIVFVETGLVIMPFLPGDSLLFASGALAALPGGGLRYEILFLIFMVAAFCGDNFNYFIGKLLGRRLFGLGLNFLNPNHLIKTEAFFARYGGNAIIMARFVPIVRTFMPFVAGMGAMPYPRFLAYSVGGAALWVGVCLTAGYLFGNLPIVKKNFSLAILAVVFISIVPVLIEFVRHRKEKKPAETES